MFILRSKIVFWENLKDEGQVVQAIIDYKNGNQNQNNQNQQDNQGTAEGQQQDGNAPQN